MKILVTGSAGSIGSELVRQLAPRNRVFCLDNNDTANFDLIEEMRLKGFSVEGRVGDVRDESVVEEVMRTFKPHAIYHAAALKVVTSAEWTPKEYIRTNIEGTLNVLDAARRHGVKKLVNVSTDKVIQHCGMMGATKRVAELLTKNYGYVSVRFGNVMGSRGSVLPLWQAQMDRGESITVTDERMERYMMTIPQAVKLLIKAGEIGEPGNVVVLDMGKPVNIMELAKGIIAQAGKNVSIRKIGMRPGETLKEELMTPLEKEDARKDGDYWIIP